MLLCLIPSCSRPGPNGKAAAKPQPAAAFEAPSKSAPIETPRTVMRAVPANEAPAVQPASDRPDLFVPVGGEAPRLPRDYAIGPLGPGSGRASAYKAASEALSLAASGKSVAGLFASGGDRADAAARGKIAPLGGDLAVRVGSPADEAGGGVSYLIRLLGKNSSLSGELHLVPGKDGAWLVDSLTLDADTITDADGDEGAPRFDPLLYKRFL